jgi:hypothetical protein
MRNNTHLSYYTYYLLCDIPLKNTAKNPEVAITFAKGKLHGQFDAETGVLTPNEPDE